MVSMLFTPFLIKLIIFFKYFAFQGIGQTNSAQSGRDDGFKKVINHESEK